MLLGFSLGAANTTGSKVNPRLTPGSRRAHAGLTPGHTLTLACIVKAMPRLRLMPKLIATHEKTYIAVVTGL